MMPVGHTLTVRAGSKERQMDFGWCQPCRNHSGSLLAAHCHTHAAFIDMPFQRSIEDADYETRFRE